MECCIEQNHLFRKPQQCHHFWEVLYDGRLQKPEYISLRHPNRECRPVHPWIAEPQQSHHFEEVRYKVLRQKPGYMSARPPKVECPVEVFRKSQLSHHFWEVLSEMHLPKPLARRRMHMFWTILRTFGWTFISLRQVRRFYQTQEFLQIMQPEQGFVWLQHACFLIIGYPKNPMMNHHVRHQSCINWRHTRPIIRDTQLPFVPFVGRSGNPSLKTTWFSQNTNILHPKRHLRRSCHVKKTLRTGKLPCEQ